ncbi:MAG: PH domain-containing protein [Bacillota bacterium]
MSQQTLTFPARPHRPKGWLWLLAGGVALLLLLALFLPARSLWALSNLQYELTPEALVITYAWEEVEIKRSAIRQVRVITPTGGIRQYGTGLPGLQHGRWSFRETGTIFLYSTTTRPLTVIETAGRTYGISPSEPDSFQRALAEGRTGRWRPVRAHTPAGILVAVVLPSLVSLGVVFLLFYLRWMGRSLTYFLTEEALLITAGWNRIRLPYSEILQARIESPRGSPWKIMGAYMPGLYWGGFYWKAAGPRLRLYSTHDKPLLLITTPRGTVGISPDQPERFLAELENRLSRR